MRYNGSRPLYLRKIIDESTGKESYAPIIYFDVPQEPYKTFYTGDLIGYTMTDSLEESDIVVYNTCAIRENAELKIFGNIGKLKAHKAAKPDMIVAVCGCMVMQQHIVDKIKKSYPFVDIVFGVIAVGTGVSPCDGGTHKRICIIIVHSSICGRTTWNVNI